MKKGYILGLLTGMGIAVLTGAAVTGAVASNGHSTIKACGGLLPQNQTLEFNINGVIDTTESSPQMTGDFSLSDETELDNPELSQQVESFVACVVRLIE